MFDMFMQQFSRRAAGWLAAMLVMILVLTGCGSAVVAPSPSGNPASGSGQPSSGQSSSASPKSSQAPESSVSPKSSQTPKGSDSSKSQTPGSSQSPKASAAPGASESSQPLTSFKDVSDYIRKHKKLPDNFITKNEAEKLGWEAAKGNLDKVAPGKSIGGDRFGNREGLLPSAKNRIWYEADINYKKGTRNADRILYSNDGLIYMTTDHYKSFKDITKEGSVAE